MAIAVPFLMSATGAAGAIAGAIGGGITAGIVSTVTAVAFQVTGINDKINKAASKVFGEDLVKFANIAGAGYAMFNGGFDIGSAGEAATDAAGNLIAAPEISATDWASQGADNMGALAEASQGIEPSGFNLADMSGTEGVKFDDGAFQPNVPTQTSGTNLFDPSKAPGTDTKLVAETKPSDAINGMDAVPPKMVEPPKPVTTGAAAPSATTQSAAGKVATSAQAPVPGATTQQNLFDRMFFDKTGKLNERMVGGVLQGVGSAYTSAQQMAQRQKEIDAENARRNSLAPGRMY